MFVLQCGRICSGASLLNTIVEALVVSHVVTEENSVVKINSSTLWYPIALVFS